MRSRRYLLAIPLLLASCGAALAKYDRPPKLTVINRTAHTLVVGVDNPGGYTSNAFARVMASRAALFEGEGFYSGVVAGRCALPDYGGRYENTCSFDGLKPSRPYHLVVSAYYDGLGWSTSAERKIPRFQ